MDDFWTAWTQQLSQVATASPPLLCVTVHVVLVYKEDPHTPTPWVGVTLPIVLLYKGGCCEAISHVTKALQARLHPTQLNAVSLAGWHNKTRGGGAALR